MYFAEKRRRLMSIIFSGFGSCIPEKVVPAEAFLNNIFYGTNGAPLAEVNENILKKFISITGIEQRRYASDKQVASDMGFLAAAKAIADAGIDPETLDGIICTHNYGDIPVGSIQSDILPSIAARIKHHLQIRNASCVAFDVVFGCPGWIQSVIIAMQFLRNGAGGRYLIVAAETLSRVLDPHDRDSMIYADGAAAAVMEYKETDSPAGILGYASRSYTEEEVSYLTFGPSLNAAHAPGRKFIKMKGRAIYEFALKEVPLAMKACLDQSGIAIGNLKKILLHQANEKMDEAILKRFYKLYGWSIIPEDVLPISIRQLGNSSVATVPTLFDMVLKGKMNGHRLKQGDTVLLASVGAGMNINALVYRM